MSEARDEPSRHGAPESRGGSAANGDREAGPQGGEDLVRASLYGTAVFVASAIASALWSATRLVAVSVDALLFAAGLVTFAIALVAAARRSRHYELGLFGLFLLEGAAPRSVRRRLLGAVLVQVVVALATAPLRRSLAFGILVPTYGVGVTGLWGARHGRFPLRGRPG